ncbi:MAG TPA: hypothetical protein VIF82_02935 [Burkholderiaceae bacterium]|jgi:hypothetical protein
MARPAMQIKFAFAQIVLMAMVTGCQSSLGSGHAENADSMPTSKKQTQVSQQLIIKFKPDTIACNADAIAQFSSLIKVPIEYVRAMSGQACVVKQFMNKDIGLSKGQMMLREHPDVEWVESDAIRKPL